MDYRDNRQRWAESHQVVHFYAGQWCTFTPALTAWERVVDSGETEAAASVNMILALYDIGQGQSDLAEEAIEKMDSIALDLIPGFVQTLYVRLASRQSGSNATTETEGEGAFGSNVILFPSRKAGRDARCP